MRWLWLRRTDPTRPWHNLIDDREPIVEALFHASVYVELGDGNTALFWSDRWINGISLQDMAPCLCNVVSTRVRAQCTVAQALTNNQWIRDISGALTVQVLIEYLQVWDQMQLIQFNQIPDRVCWKWTADRCFSTASAYRSFFLGQYAVEGAKLLCKARAPPKCKFFIWLVIHDRCWIAHRRKRRNLQVDDSCALCCQEPETIDHLLTSCVFSREIWFRIFLRLGWSIHVPPAACTAFADWWTSAHKRIAKPDRKSFDSLLILAAWCLWKERNRRIFDHQTRSTADLFSLISDEVVFCAKQVTSSWFQ